MTFVVCLCLWILQGTFDQIAKLAYVSCGIKKNPDLDPKYDIVRLMVFFEFSAWYFQIPSNGVFVGVSMVALIAKFYLQQAEFARLDRGSRTKRDKTYIYSAGPTQSGWANDPNVLKHMPAWINSRHLTCMTLVEIAFLLYASYVQPEDGPFFLAFTMMSHYITDALDGGLGRYRKEGYVLWGFYADHAFDALYESASILSLWMMMNYERSSPGYIHVIETDDIFGPLAHIMINLFVFGFHSTENLSCQKKLASHYSNLVGTMPLHYLEWFCSAYLLLMQFRHLSVTWNVLLVLTFLSGGISFLVAWHINVWRTSTK